ncbi:hypothetical protein D3C86_1744860 [compost metagenome]|jgi:hypothetical protein|uniref:hypothetical protein n=1 Tax=Achromobacter TaxID=222 RepID=UPI000FBA96DC|nr:MULTISPECIES: hypothetical protein [Achromobacter]
MGDSIGQRVAYVRIAALEASVGTVVVARRACNVVTGARLRLSAVLGVICSVALLASFFSNLASVGEIGYVMLADFAALPWNKALIAYLGGYAVCSCASRVVSVARRLGREEMTRASFLRDGAQRSNWPRNILRERD